MSGASKILVVDDEPNIRLTTRMALETSGMLVDEVEDGKAALERLLNVPVDLVLLDLWMPRLDGLETLRQLRERGDKTPVVIVTAHGCIPDTVAAMRLGAIDFLQKPMTPEALRTVVAEVLQRHSPVKAEPIVAAAEPETDASRFAEKMMRAKQALNRLEFEEAEFFLGQAQALAPRSIEAARLRGVLSESRRVHEGPFRMMRELFPVGRTHRRGR